MKLLNVIEIDPWNYTEKEYEVPLGSRNEDPKQWSEFWYRCLSDSNLNHLRPIELGSFFVDITKIKDSELETIVRTELKDVDLSDYKNHIGCLNGGIVIKEKGKVVIEPTCCSDLSDLFNWEEIGKTTLDKWTQLWIGHPWVFYKKNNDTILFSDYTEDNLEDFKEIPVKYKLSVQELMAEIKLIKEDYNVFEKRVYNVLKEFIIE